MNKVIHKKSTSTINAKGVMKRHFKSALALFMPLFAVSCLTISSALILSSSGSTAIETEAITTTVKVLEACSMTANPDSTDTAHSVEMIGGTVENNIGVTTIDVTCNDFNGYSVYAVGYGNNTEGNTDLTGAVTGQTIPTGTNMTTSVSNWAMRLTAVDDSTNYFVPTILSDANGSFAENHAVPSTNTKVVTFQNAIDVSKPSRFTTTYAAAVTPYQVADTYTGQVKYTLVHPNYADAAGEVGKYYMQDLNSTVLANLLPNVNNTIIVYDKRDEQPYKIAKLADGKYWMVENLNLAGGTTITSADSDVTEDYTLPTSATKNENDNNLTDSTQFSDDNTAYVYNTGKRTSDCTNGCYSYYSYLAATAGTGASLTDDGVNATGSICPKGWRLPTATTSNASATINNNWKTGDFYTLATAYGANLESNYTDNSGATGANFYTNAGAGTTAGFLLAGDYYDSTFYSGGSFGLYWSSTSESGTYAYHLNLNSARVNSAYNYYRRGGFSVRCIFDHEDVTDITTMQEMTPTIAAYTPQGTTATLTDSRDNEQYLVSKLADNNIWMLDNLRLGATTLTTDLTSNNTNLSTTISAADWNSYNTTENFNSYTAPMFNNESANTTVTSYGAGSGKVGVYYNYCAASAGTICSDSNSSNASYDICPKGWRIPTGGSSGEYQALYTAYSENVTNFRNALSTPLSGDFYNSSASNQGSYGHFWSSTYYDGYAMYTLYVYSSNVNPTDGNGRYRGFSVRCVLK